MILENSKIIENVDYKPINVKGTLYLIEKNYEKGFNFPYTLFIPENMDDDISLIVEGANTGTSKNDINEAINDVINDCMNRGIIKWNTLTNFPILTPCIPRINDNNEGIYTHMLTSKALFYKKNNLKRIDNQLINMIKDALSRFENIDSKIILDGFSASAKFVNRFALLHPEIVKLVIAGGCSGTGILPLKEINNEKLLYPIGCGNLDEINDKKIELFKNIKQFYYMGDLDPCDNDPLGEQDNGLLISEDSITRSEANQLYKYIGRKMYPDRWDNIQKIYKKLNINATFKTYNGFGHTPVPATNDIIKLLIKEKNNR